jgi:uncharacterized phage protein gp47/JayE
MKRIPTIKELFQTIEADFKSKLNIDDVQSKMVINALGSVLSAQFKMVYLYISDVQNNLFPDTADTVENGGQLNRMGNIYLNRQPKPATNGKYILKITGVADSKLRNNITLKSNDDSKNPGKLFILESDYFLSGVNDTIEVRSLESGGLSSLDIGNQLTITEPVIGVDATAEVVSISQVPLESETIEDYRKKIIDAIQLEPQGGAKTDYRLWSQDAQGVSQVYPYVKENNAGTVQVFVEAKKYDSEDGNGTPSAYILDLVREVIIMDPDETKPINERGRKPMQTILEVLPITLKPVDIIIYGLAQNNIDIQSLLRTNLDLFLSDIRPFIDGADLLKNKNDFLYSGKAQGVVSDSLGGGNFFNDLKTFVDGQEVVSFQFSLSNIPYLRNVEYQ